jgi:DUF2997 family protein
MQEIIIKVDAEAKVTVAVGGVKGQSCGPLTAEIERALGKIVLDQKTADYFAKEEARAGARNQH